MLKIAKLAIRSKAIKRYLRSHKVRKLQLGTGPNILSGWFNTDLSPNYKNVYILDVTRRFPFDDKSIDYILSEHIIEHLLYQDALVMLRECFRVLKQGAKIRVATPDLEILIGLHSPEKNEIQQAYIKWHIDNFLPGIHSYNDCFVINNAFRGWGHQFIYDEGTLRDLMRKAGFIEIKRCKPGESDEETFVGIEWRAKDEVQQFTGLVLEASRPDIGS